MSENTEGKFPHSPSKPRQETGGELLRDLAEGPFLPTPTALQLLSLRRGNLLGRADARLEQTSPVQQQHLCTTPTSGLLPAPKHPDRVCHQQGLHVTSMGTQSPPHLPSQPSIPTPTASAVKYLILVNQSKARWKEFSSGRAQGQLWPSPVTRGCQSGGMRKTAPSSSPLQIEQLCSTTKAGPTAHSAAQHGQRALKKKIG